MREVDCSHGQMKTEGVKLAAFRTMPSSGPAKSLPYGDGCDDPRVKAMWDEEFFGHELPSNYKISRAPDGPERRKQDAFGRRDVTLERALWDEEVLAHRIPSNYTISRFRTSEGQERRKQEDFDVRPGDAKISATSCRGSNRHTRYSDSEDTCDYNFDKTVDSYVLSEASPGKDEWCCMAKQEALSAASLPAKHECVKVETFEERALRFGVEDWNLFGNRKWTPYECNNASKGGSKRFSTRRGIFHSPSGSDTSSMISTLESSSFTCGSEGSSFAKTDLSSSSFNLSYVYAMSGGPNPLAAVGRYPSGFSLERRTGEEHCVEYDVFDAVEKLDSGPPQVKELKKDGSGTGTFFEFNFRDGKVVDGENFDAGGVRMKTSDGSERRTEGAGAGAEQRSPEAACQAVASKSPDSENFFDSSHDSDWSGTHSGSTGDHQGGPVLARDTIFFDSDNCSNFTEDRGAEDWSGEHHFYDVESSLPHPSSLRPPCTPPRGVIKVQDLHSHAEHKVAATSSPLISRPDSTSASAAAAAAAAAKLCKEEKSSSRSPKKPQVSSRKTRSLGSVLSHHLAFTAVPSLRHRSQPSVPTEQKESPAKVTPACIEWLWPDKEAMKPVQALRALAERENAERDRIGSSPRCVDHTKAESRTFGLGKAQHAFSSRTMDMPTMKRVETSPRTTTTTTTTTNTATNATPTTPTTPKESRDSILASWAAVYGTGGDSAAAARAAKKPAAPSAKVSMSAISSKHSPKAGVSPRKRSVSFGAQAGSKAATSLTKQPVQKSLALELEVLCRPFGPVLKGVRFLPTAKRGLGRPPLFSNLGRQLASSSSSSSLSAPAAELKCGRLQCVVSRDGLPSYSLIMDETEEIFAAKTLRVDAGLQEGVSHVYTFHSYRGKVKGKSGWRQWGKKEKPGSDFAGNMTVTSTICPALGCNGMQNYMESEFVLFDAKVKEISISGPTSTSPYPRSSFSSWDTATPQRSPMQGASPFVSSPSSTYFSLPSPSGALCTTPTNGASAVPARQLTIPSVSPFEKGSSRAKNLERHVSMTSPSHGNPKSTGHESSMSDSETAEDCDSRGTCAALPQSQSELAAVVVRTPMEKSQGKAAPAAADKWGWGINFLRKSFDGSKSANSADLGAAASALDSKDKGSPGSSSSDGSRSSTDQRLWSSSATDHNQEKLTINLILPSGEHGCSANGIDGPQPLIERWKSGGKCDCGSWDLGCGLTIVGNQKVSDSVDAPVKGQLRDDALQLYVEGKKQQTVGLTLTPLKEGCYTLGFQAPISPLHAFATAVAVLHSRDPVISSKKAGEAKKRLTRIPVKVVPSTRSFTRQTEDPSGSRSLMSYKLVCPDPPSSPFGRA